MVLRLSAVMLGSILLVGATSQQVPNLDVEQSCKGVEIVAVWRGRTVEACKKQEFDAKEQVSRQWQTFSAADRESCVGLTTLGGVASGYVELLTCLEMRRDEKKSSKPMAVPTTGRSSR